MWNSLWRRYLNLLNLSNRWLTQRYLDDNEMCSLNVFLMSIPWPNHKFWLQRHTSVLLLFSSPPIPPPPPFFYFIMISPYLSPACVWSSVSLRHQDVLALVVMWAKCCMVFWLLQQSLVPFHNWAAIFQKNCMSIYGIEELHKRSFMPHFLITDDLACRFVNQSLTVCYLISATFCFNDALSIIL